MTLSLPNLDKRTRQLMLQEIELDINNGTLYLSSRLSDQGKQDYVSLLKQAALEYEVAWFAQSLRQNRRINTTEQKHTPKGGVTVARVPVTAAETLAEGEFNRFYVRGICCRAIEDSIRQVVVFRAKQVANPRLESEAKLGHLVEAKVLLDDLRAHPGVDTALGLPNGPNSGLSVKLP